jgi:hypothetical protein
VLRELGLPRGLRALSLLSFNTGVEIGQLMFVIVLFPLVGLLRPTALPVRQTLSVGLIAIALYWFAQRALG